MCVNLLLYFVAVCCLPMSSYLVCVFKSSVNFIDWIGVFFISLHWFQPFTFAERASEFHQSKVSHTDTCTHANATTQSHTLYISYFDPVTIFADFQSCFSSSNNNHRDDSSFSFNFNFYEPKKNNRKPSVQREPKIWIWRQKTQRKKILSINPLEINCARMNSNSLIFSEIWTNTIYQKQKIEFETIKWTVSWTVYIRKISLPFYLKQWFKSVAHLH